MNPQESEGPSGEEPEVDPQKIPGILAWMARNSVAANVIMVILIVGGLFMIPRIRQEVFPEFELDMVVINVPYPGASPEEVEEGVLLPIEEAVRGVDGIKEVSATAPESLGVVVLELLIGADADRVLADVKSAIDRISSFPSDVEEPVVSRPQLRGEVISLIVYGDLEEADLRALGDQVRDDLLQEPNITTVEVSGTRPLEVSVEIPQRNLRPFGLTHGDVAQAIRIASVDLPAGAVRTPQGEVLLRTTERRDLGEEFADITVLSRPDGSQVRVRDLGRVVDGFREVDSYATYEGQRALMVQVYRVGEQTPLDLAATVHEYIRLHEVDLPQGAHFATWNDRAEFYRDRIDLLLRNAYIGLFLVMVSLGLFLEIRLAFWVTMGIPISFIGSLLVMPQTDASINMISLFAFILTLGMVVDDAIVVGEAIYTRRTQGVPPLQAAIEGVQEVAQPVVFAILTTCMAFAPLLFVPGVMGKFFMQIPIVVILVLLLSLFESLFILPAHLGHRGGKIGRIWWLLGIPAVIEIAARIPLVHRTQQRFSKMIEWLITKTYAPMLELALKHRYTTLAVSVATLIASIGLVAGGLVEVTFFPKIDGDIIKARITMPFGTPAEDTAIVQERVLLASERTLAALSPDMDSSLGRFSLLGGFGADSGGPGGGPRGGGSHMAEVAVSTVSSDIRPFTAREFSERWRQEVGEVPGVESLTFHYSTGAGSEAPIDFQLSHSNLTTLEEAAAHLAAGLERYAGLSEINDGFTEGKEQLDFTLLPAARALGVTESMLARQVRDAFFGAEAGRQQRGRDELLVYVRRPLSERRSLADLENLIIRTPQGGELPLSEAAEIHRGHSYTEIRRIDARRRVNVTAEVEESVNANRIMTQAQADLIPELLAHFPGLHVELGGSQKRQAETKDALAAGFLMSLLGMFGLLAVAFKSYSQPFIIVTAIPFGFVGAVLGHIIIGYDLSLMSMMGFVALAGVVVNDSLVMVSAINDYHRKDGMPIGEAVRVGGVRRFRPILLTSITTFLGLSPMILETSVGARFLIPMAISLGFGVLVATLITLLLVPSLYLIIEDLKGLSTKVNRLLWG